MPDNKKPKAKVKRSADLSEIAFQRLLQAVVSGELKEGERVRESRIAEEWGIGVTPMREAVRRMGALGYLVLKPNHAPVVRKLSAEDVAQIYGVREALECFALGSKWDSIKDSDLKVLRTVARKCEGTRGKARGEMLNVFDEKLHGLWISDTNNPWLDASFERIVAYLPGLSRELGAHQKYLEVAFKEHQLILSALEERERSKAVKLLGDHIRNSGAAIVEIIKEKGS